MPLPPVAATPNVASSPSSTVRSAGWATISSGAVPTDSHSTVATKFATPAADQMLRKYCSEASSTPVHSAGLSDGLVVPSRIRSFGFGASTIWNNENRMVASLSQATRTVWLPVT